MTMEFIKLGKELIMVYTPISGATEILKRIKSDDGYNIKNIFWTTTSMLRELEDYDEDSICISVGKERNGYVEMDQNVINTKHKFFFKIDFKFSQKTFVAYKNISILRKIDEVIDRDIYIGNEESGKVNGYCLPEYQFEELVKTFPNSSELKKYVSKRIVILLKEVIPQCDKYEHIYETYVKKKEKSYIKNNQLSIPTVNKKIKVEQFTVALAELKSLLTDCEESGEIIWQEKVQNILQLIYPQYILSAREMSFSGIDGYDKQPDFVLIDANGFIDIMEIKKPTVRILTKQASYRNNYVPVREFAGAIQQIEKYIYCLNSLNKKNDRFLTKLSELLHQKITPQVVNPKGILLLGRSNDFDAQQARDFELIKRQYKNIADIMTYDDLIFKYENIVKTLSE